MTLRLREERGFVLSVVIFAVAALSIAGTALFLVVQSENAMANSGAESSTAYHLANAGLSRYMGETFGEPLAEVTYEMGGGTVTVTAEHVLALEDTADMYLVRSEAVIADRRVADLVSRRTVQQFALLERRPFTPMASFVLASSNAKTRNVTIDGRDQCANAHSNVAGVVSLGNGDIRGSLHGDPAVSSSSYAQLMTDIGLDWEALKDTTFRYDYEVPEDAWPDFGYGLLADASEFPTIRVDGDLRAYDTNSGRGLLVVTGNVQFYDGFRWDGAILAGSITSSSTAFTVNGTLMTGFARAQNRIDIRNATMMYNSCHVLSATQGIAMLSPIPNTWWETSQ